VKVRVPGDKSLSQRALILAALAEGESRLTGLVHGGDAESTAGALRAMGVPIPALPGDGSTVRIRGVGLRGLTTPASTLDLGNSGTGTRLLMGVVAGSDVEARFDGDASLRTRPMARVVDPLRTMGAAFTADHSEGLLPLTVRGRWPLEPIDWPTAIASAQVKSAILLAGLTGRAFALVTEPRQSRDHTERLLNQVGASVISHATEGGWRVELRDPPERIDPLDLDVPGDFSSAAFVVGLAAMGGAGAEVVIEGVGVNPTRTAFLDVLLRMGGDVVVEETTPAGAVEPVGSLVVRPSSLVATEIEAAEVPRLIDELPIIAALAARAVGTTVITGASELRSKESDRIHAMVSNLQAVGVSVDELPDGLVVHGSSGPLAGSVRSWHDHRIAMAFAVLGALPGNHIEVDHPEVAGVSFPGFQTTIHALTAGA
jgi:3-phosphoshikimate 1-carboxyvinyltransferase